MIQRIVLAIALSAAPLCAGHATRAYHDWLVDVASDGWCDLWETTMRISADPSVRFQVQLDRGIPQLAEVYVSAHELKVGMLTFSIDGHTFKALHLDVPPRDPPDYLYDRPPDLAVLRG